MKKTIFFAVLASMVLASCNKQEVPAIQTSDKQEVSVVAFNSLATKGYTGWAAGKTAFEEVVNPSDEAAVATIREMSLSAFDATKKEDFFVGQNYSKDEADGLWHADPKIYYPLGNDSFNFLAYSVGNEANYIGEWENANKVTLEVTDAFYQDDIIFATGSASAAAPTVDLEFKHAQAWIHFNINIAAESEKDLPMTINSITWKNIYNQGLLTIEGNGAEATAKWNYFTQAPKDVVMTDPNDTFPITLAAATVVEETPAAGAVSQIDMLLPAEQSHANFVLNYGLGEQKNLEFECPITAGKWDMGVKYIYNVKITINEVTAAPTVEVFTEEVEDLAI